MSFTFRSTIHLELTFVCAVSWVNFVCFFSIWRSIWPIIIYWRDSCFLRSLKCHLWSFYGWFFLGFSFQFYESICKFIFLLSYSFVISLFFLFFERVCYSWPFAFPYKLSNKLIKFNAYACIHMYACTHKTVGICLRIVLNFQISLGKSGISSLSL